MLASHEARLTKLEAGMEVLNADMAEVKETLRLILQHLMGQSAFPAGIVNKRFSEGWTWPRQLTFFQEQMLLKFLLL